MSCAVPPSAVEREGAPVVGVGGVAGPREPGGHLGEEIGRAPIVAPVERLARRPVQRVGRIALKPGGGRPAIGRRGGVLKAASRRGCDRLRRRPPADRAPNTPASARPNDIRCDHSSPRVGVVPAGTAVRRRESTPPRSMPSRISSRSPALARRARAARSRPGPAPGPRAAGGSSGPAPPASRAAAGWWPGAAGRWPRRGAPGCRVRTDARNRVRNASDCPRCSIGGEAVGGLVDARARSRRTAAAAPARSARIVGADSRPIPMPSASTAAAAARPGYASGGRGPPGAVEPGARPAIARHIASRGVSRRAVILPGRARSRLVQRIVVVVTCSVPREIGQRLAQPGAGPEQLGLRGAGLHAQRRRRSPRACSPRRRASRTPSGTPRAGRRSPAPAGP